MEKLRTSPVVRSLLRLPQRVIGNWIRSQGFVRLREVPSVILPEDQHLREINAVTRAKYHEIKEEAFWKIAELCWPYTLLSVEQIYDIYKSVEYLCKKSIPGAIVECGVFKGGSMLAAAETLAHFGDTSRTLYLFDTFTGMTSPTEQDLDIVSYSMVAHYQKYDHTRSCYLKETQDNMRRSRYPFRNMVFIPGPVEQTIPQTTPDPIAYLRLDTDWYASTKHELIHLYPKLVPGGVLIIDDYGAFQGARQAVDEYFQETKQAVRLARIDYTCRSGVKCN